MSSIIMDKVNFLVNQLKKRVKQALSRRNGFLKSSSVVQHLNPACRAARSVPHLSLARLLISLNDYDVPTAKSSVKSIFGYVYGTMFWLLLSLILILSILPELLQDVFFESMVTVVVNILYFSIFSGSDDLYVAFGIGTAFIFGIFVLAEIVVRKYRINRKTYQNKI